MKILAIEFSSAQRSVAVAAAAAAGARGGPWEVAEDAGRGGRALGMVEEALRQAQLEREQIECLAIGLGPGSYTGIRSAIALAQGWQLASGSSRVESLGLSSVQCIAAQAQAEGVRRRVAVVIDAQREEFYLALYEIDGGSLREVEPLRLATRPEVEAHESHALIVGPEVNRWFPAGRVIFPRALTLAQLAAGRTGFLYAEKLEPIYLREAKFVKAPPPRVPRMPR